MLKTKIPHLGNFCFVPSAGFEPAIPFGNGVLSAARMPSSATRAFGYILYYSKGFLARGAGALYLESNRSSFSVPSAEVIVLVK